VDDLLDRAFPEGSNWQLFGTGASSCQGFPATIPHWVPLYPQGIQVAEADGGIPGPSVQQRVAAMDQAMSREPATIHRQGGTGPQMFAIAFIRGRQLRCRNGIDDQPQIDDLVEPQSPPAEPSTNLYENISILVPPLFSLPFSPVRIETILQPLHKWS
jgi:hypothetical protein